MERYAKPEYLIGLEEEINTIEKAIEDFETGKRSNVAVISEPFYGVERIVDKIESIASEKCKRMPSEDLVHDLESMDRLMKNNILIVENLHRIYRRKIGGFKDITKFQKYVSTSDKLFITTWNLPSWNYLDEVLHIGKQFPLQVTLPKKDANQIKEMLLSGYEENELSFVGIEVPRQEDKFLKVGWRSAFILGREIKIPNLEVEIDILRYKLGQKKRKSAEELFFEKIARISDGNPGVAEVLWKAVLDYPNFVDRLEEPHLKIELDRAESFALSAIISADFIERSELCEIVGSPDELLYVLSEGGLITVDGEICSARPEALKEILEYLNKQRLVW